MEQFELADGRDEALTWNQLTALPPVPTYVFKLVYRRSLHDKA